MRHVILAWLGAPPSPHAIIYWRRNSDLHMSTEDNLTFTPLPISAPAIGLGDGASVRVAIGVVQRMAALRAYDTFTSGRDWMEKLSIAYVVALATRSADTLLMQHLQNSIVEEPPFSCSKCREATIGTDVIRKRIFPTLSLLRAKANKLIHHLDKPENRGITELDVKSVFDYCYHLFQENAAVLLGATPELILEFSMCKLCKQKHE